MTPVEIAKRLNANPDVVVQHLFKGAATFKGGRWSIGNLDGEAGESLVIYKNSGRFKDFSTSDEGDVLELLSKRYGSKGEGIKVAHQLLGITMAVKRSDPTSGKSEGKIIKWEKPEKDWSQLTEKDNPDVIKYLVEERKIPLEVLKQVGVKGKDNKEYVFIRKTHDEKPIPCGAFYVSLERKEVDGRLKKIIHQSTSPLDTLYGHDTCKRGVERNGKTYIIITGGQIDMLSYRSIGVMNSVSIPAGEGAMKWAEASWDFLKEFQEIYIHLDNDSTGVKMTEKIAQKLGYERCHRCVLPPYYKDANEAYVKGYDLLQAINNAVDFRPDMLVSAGEIMEAAMSILAHGRREDQGIPFMGWESENESIRFRIRPREMTLITGVPGHGKSSILYQKVAYLVFVKKEKCFIASLEEDPEVILGLIATQALAAQHNPKDKKNFRAFMEVMKELDEYVWFYNYRGRTKADDVLAKAEYVVRKHDVKHVIFDSIAKTDLNIEKNEECNEFVGKICKSMTETGAHYYCVAHPRKGDGKLKGYNAMVGLDDIKGSSSLGVETFNCITMWKNEAKEVMLKSARKSGGMFTSKKQLDENGLNRRVSEEELMLKGDGVIWISKQKVGGQTGRHDLWYNPNCYRLERNSSAESIPYALEIYEKYIGNGTSKPPEF